MKKISKRKLKPNYKKNETTQTEQWTEIKRRSRAGIEYTKFKRTLINK